MGRSGQGLGCQGGLKCVLFEGFEKQALNIQGSAAEDYRGVVNRMFRPLELWQAQCAGQVSGRAVPAEHFIPEELPELTAQVLTDFMV